MSLLTRPPFPAAVDSTMLKAYRACPQLFFKQYLHHYKPLSDGIHLLAGKAFAEGLEAMRRGFFEKGMNSEESLNEGIRALIIAYGDPQSYIKEAKSLERMCGALEYYATVAYPLSTDPATPHKLPSGERAIEFSFALELDPELRHPVSGEPMLYTGRCDQICDFSGGLWPEDDKTTSQLGDRWGEQWKLRSQFTGYAWAARQFFEKVQGVLVTGIAIRKTGYDHQRCPTPRTDQLVSLWHNQTIIDIRKMMAMWEAGYWDYNLDESCGSYGGCIFRDVCGRQDEQSWLDVGFVQREWNPIARMEQELALNPEGV